MLTNLGDNEAKRRAAIEILKSNDRGRDEALQNYTYLACRLLDVPVCFISILDDGKQYIKSAHNVLLHETDLGEAFCAHTISIGKASICNDTLQDEAFQHYRYVENAPFIRFYGGCPLKTREGITVGTLCILDTRAHAFSPAQMDDFERIAGLIAAFLESWHAVGYVDIVTLLPNRQRLLRDIASLEDRVKKLVIIDCIDMPFAYEIARSLGMIAVENLLQDVVVQLQSRLKIAEPLYAVAVGRFAFLINDNDAVTLENISERLRGVQARLNGEIPLNLDIHVGDSGECAKELTPVEILRRSVSALHEAITRKKRFMTYDADIDNQKKNEFQLLTELRKALHEEKGLYLVYQPKISLISGNVTGVEALLRWHHPLFGEVMPGQFIPLVEKTRLMNELTDWVIDRSVEQLRAWCDKGLDLSISINIAASDFSRPGFTERLDVKMSSQGLPPALLGVECLETEKILESPEALRGLELLKQRGFKIYLDDFGSGYSNINYLRQIPMDVIKLDRSIVGAISTDKGSLVIVRNVINLLKQLDYDVLAEGVEDKETVDILRSLGCDEVQGFFYSRPLIPALFEKWFFARSRRVLAEKG